MKPEFFDIHSHINFNAFKDDGDEVIKRTLAAGIWTILVGSQYDTSKRAVEYALKYKEGVYAAVGLHPFHLIEQDIDMNEEGLIKNLNFLRGREKMLKDKNPNSAGGQKIKSRAEEFDFEKYLALAASSEKVAAIGECGLDYKKSQNYPKQITSQFNGASILKFKNDKEIIKKQIETFKKQIELALKLNKPLMVHCRNCHQDTIKILESYRSNSRLRGNIHFFTGTWEEAKKYFNLNFSISFTGIVTFTNSYDEVIKKSPLAQIMIETEAPYLAPVPYRGKRNEPIYVKEIARRIAEIKNTSLEKVAEATTKNALKMFAPAF